MLVVLSGMSTLAQVEDNTAYMQDMKPLTEKEQAITLHAKEAYRRVCTARSPHCGACPLSALCRDYQTRQAESAARSAHESDTLAL